MWEWGGTNWTHESPGAMPPASEAPAGAVVGVELVIFGGEGIDFEPLGDTWTYDGSSWTQLSPAHSPSPRRGAVAAALDGKMVLFGGDVISPSSQDWLSVDETWVWDGTDWTQQQPPQSPPARSFAGMAAAGGQVVLFGGANFGGDFVESRRHVDVGRDELDRADWPGARRAERARDGRALTFVIVCDRHG